MNIVTKGEFNLSRVNTICFKKKDFTLHFSLYFPPRFFFLRRKDSYDPSSCKMGGEKRQRRYRKTEDSLVHDKIFKFSPPP